MEQNEQAQLINEFFQSGGQISYSDDGIIGFYDKETKTWHTIDKTLSDFFGDRHLDEVLGTQEHEDMIYYVALKWKEETQGQ